MPPEIILGQNADARSDIYSFGATLHFAATGKLPFTDTTQIGLFAAHIKSAPPPLSEASSLPFSPAFEQVVQRCMAKEPEARFPNTQAVLAALEARDEA
jgi:serine/threonine-protein kinase